MNEVIVYGYITIYVMLVISLNDISLITEGDYCCLPVNTVDSPNITEVSLYYYYDDDDDDAYNHTYQKLVGYCEDYLPRRYISQ